MPKQKHPLLLEFAVMLASIAYFIQSNNNQTSCSTLYTAVSFSTTHIKGFSFAETVNVQQGKQTHARATKHANSSLGILLLLLAGDIQMNPGPGNRSVFPCGCCDIPVTWSQEGVCCNNCSVWYHKSCEDLSSRNMSYLGRSSVIWHCCKCDSINVDSFTFNSFELNTSNVFNPLLDIDASIDSVDSSCFSPLQTSSPQTSNRSRRASHHHSRPPSDTSHSVPGLAESAKSIPESDIPKRSTNLRLLTVNCCGLRTNRSEFSAALDYIKPDLICGTKSWLRGVKPGKDPEKNAIKTSEVFPTNYTIHRNDRSTGIGGGVFTAVKEGIITDAQPQLTTECEIVWSKVKTENKNNTYLCSFYMPHRNLTDIQMLDESIQRIQQSKNGKHIILAGDFNCPDVDWENATVKKGAVDREVQQALLDLSIEHGLTQIQDQPTRDSNLLDLVFTNNPSLVKTSTSVPGISDHAMAVTDIDNLPQFIRQKPRKFFIFSKANWDSIEDDMKCLSESITSTVNSSVDDLWTKLKTGIEESMNKNIPSKVSKSRKSVPWFDKDLRKMVRRKSRLYRHAKKTKQWGNYKAYQKECKIAFKKAEINHINNTIQKGLDEQNTKPFWRYVKSRCQDFIGVAPLKKMGHLINDRKEQAQILVEQFKSTFTLDSDASDLPDTRKRAKRPIPPLNITTEGVEKLLQNIKVNKATGPDQIPNILMKRCAHQIAPAMRSIFQLSVETGKLPKDWLNANVSPVFKKGDAHLPENYRPVSLTCVSCKLLEHIICKHILDHLEKNKILTSLNHGFRSGYSCETQLVTTIHDLLGKFDVGTQIDMVILDFSKAFDTVPHRKLLHKMEQYGVTGNINSWLCDFLTNRQMKVVVDGEESEAVHVDSGVPQGTVLGPLLFLCHINDLPDAVKSTVRLFADDCLLYRPINSIKDHHTLQHDLQQLEIWAKKWGMRFNAKKCYIMSINNKSSHFYELDKHILQQVPENPYLGITISEDLKWTSHINKISRKANSTLGFLRRNLKHCPESCRKTAYLALIRSSLEYSSVVWDPHLQKDIEKLLKKFKDKPQDS